METRFHSGNFWAASFALGIVNVGSPLLILLMLLAALVALGCLPARSDKRPRSARDAALVSGGLALVLTAPQWMMGLAMLPIIGSIFRFVLHPVHLVTGPFFRFAGAYTLLLMAGIFIASLAWWVLAARRAALASVSD